MGNLLKSLGIARPLFEPVHSVQNKGPILHIKQAVEPTANQVADGSHPLSHLPATRPQHVKRRQHKADAPFCST